MSSVIVFPFDYKKDNKEMFVKTFQIAALENAKVVLFTTVEGKIPNEKFDVEINIKLDKELDEIYFHLFELIGFFQTHYNKWEKIGISMERVIRQGDFNRNLIDYVSELKYPVKVVATQGCEKMNKEKLEAIFGHLPSPPKLIH